MAEGKSKVKWSGDIGSQDEEGAQQPPAAPQKATEARLPVPGRSVQPGEGFVREKEPEADILKARQAAAGEDSQESAVMDDSALPMGDEDVVTGDPADSQLADYLEDVAQESGFDERQVPLQKSKQPGKKP